ncbi:MAG: FecR domain-containing protein [Balneolaceae bacterium]|nr:FecR domain-containing protein [Balneolaceae bacterium]
MDNKSEIPINLLQNWLNGNCTRREAKVVERWLKQSPENIDLLDHLVRTDMASFTGFDQEKVKSEILKKIESMDPDFGKQKKKSEKYRLYSDQPGNQWQKSGAFWWLRAAAAILVFISAGLFTSMYEEADIAGEEIVFKEVISPSRTITTLTLSDGSVVELNANSSLRYPDPFPLDERFVYLEGEAFFNVAGESDRTFIVRSGSLKTTVLGTEFNVNYMKELDRVDVALVEGRVSVEPSVGYHQQSEIILEPNQWIRYTGSNGLQGIQKGVESRLLWRDGILEFEEKNMLEVASTLEYWYGVDIEVEGESAKVKEVTGTFRDVSLEHVLETLKFVVGIEYEMQKNSDEEIDKVLIRIQE